MPKRGDHIHKRKDGRWEGRYPRGRRADGVLQYGSIYGQTYGEVKQKLSQIPIQPIAKRNVSGNTVTVASILEQWMAANQSRLKGATLHKYQMLIDNHKGER